MTSIAEPTMISNGGDVLHPEWCSRVLCSRVGADVVHREVPVLFVLENHSDAFLSVGRVRADELCGDEQAVFPHEVEVCPVGNEKLGWFSAADVARLNALTDRLSEAA